MTAGELLRGTRRRHGLTQRQLAMRAQTSQAAISRIERGVVSPSVDTLAELLWMMNEELVLQVVQIDWGFDTDLLEANLSLSPEERVSRGVERMRHRSSAVHPNERTRPIPIEGAPVVELRRLEGDLGQHEDRARPWAQSRPAASSIRASVVATLRPG